MNRILSLSAHHPDILFDRLKSLRTQDDPDVIKAYTDILGSLMQATEDPVMDEFQARDCYSSMTINILTMNHRNLTRNPNLDGRELKGMPMRDRPITRMLLHNSAHIICLNEADAQDEKCKELIRLFILTGHKGIEIKPLSARPIACFVRGNERARVELLARYISTRSQNWGARFGMFKYFFGTEIGCIDPEYNTPTFDCLAIT